MLIHLLNRRNTHIEKTTKNWWYVELFTGATKTKVHKYSIGQRTLWSVLPFMTKFCVELKNECVRYPLVFWKPGLSHLVRYHIFLLNPFAHRKVFWCFQGVEKGCIGNKWVNSVFLKSGNETNVALRDSNIVAELLGYVFAF